MQKLTRSTWVAILLVGGWPGLAAAAGRFDLPAGPGRDLVYGHCQTCHDLQSVVDSAGIRKGAGDAVLDNMKNFGLRVTPDQRSRILDYLGTYMGPNPPPASDTSTAGGAETVNGRSVYMDTCMGCHQEAGTGKDAQFPPLAQNPDLFLSDAFPAYVVLDGIRGQINVGGVTFDNAMPSFDFLSDREIAAVIAYVRSSWGNADLRPAGITDPDASQVADVRQESLSSEDVAAMRRSLIK